MKEKDMKATPSKQTFVMYAEKEDGTYGSFETGSYLIENDLDDFWKKMEHREKVMREKLLSGACSPIEYYMVIEELTPTELAQRTGIGLSKVKKHLSPEGFGKARVSQIEKYASVFNIAVANLFQMVLSSQGKNIKYHFYNKEDDQTEVNQIVQYKSKNPLVVTAKIEEIRK